MQLHELQRRNQSCAGEASPGWLDEEAFYTAVTACCHRESSAHGYEPLLPEDALGRQSGFSRVV